MRSCCFFFQAEGGIRSIGVTGVQTCALPIFGGLLGGAAGMLQGLVFGSVRFNMGFIPGLKAFTAAVLGGIGSIRGAMLGGVVLGLFENFAALCVSNGARWKDVLAFIVLVLVLMIQIGRAHF